MASAFAAPFIQNIFNNENHFYSVVNQLASQNALPAGFLMNEVPFFNIPSISVETHIKELFENSCDVELCKHLLNAATPLSEGAEHNLVPQNYLPGSAMSFAQIVLYKVLPCPDSNCPNCPREIATHNQYKDFEYQCPFYHHEKDRRRLVIPDVAGEEFAYKANYFEERKRAGDKDKYSQNYFESVFHPLYYKMFHCKRHFCNQPALCPFYHSEDEKRTWDNTFSIFMKKDRDSYVNKQQKVNERKPARGQETKGRVSSDEETNGQEVQDYAIRASQRKQTKNVKLGKQQYQQVYYEETQKNFEMGWKNPVIAYRKDSDSSFEEKHGSRGIFTKLQISTRGDGIY